MLKKILFRIQVLIESTRSFLVRAIVTLLIICFACAIVHNIIKMSEVSSYYTGEYKKLIPINEENYINVYDVGNSEGKTIVILPGFGSHSPIIQYKTLIEGLKDNNRVIVIEYYGYGYSMGSNDKRTTEVIADEINRTLEYLGVGRCVFVAHSISNLYACEFTNMFPDKVEGIISLDGVYPSEIKNDYLKVYHQDQENNIKITSVLELTGFARVLSYLKIDTFYIDKMLANPIYTKEDIKIYRNRIGSSYLTPTMVREIDQLTENMTKLSDYKYPDYLPVLQLMSSESVEKYKGIKSQTKRDLVDFSNDMISNSEIQSNIEIKGDHMLQLTATEETLNSIRNFISGF